MPGALLNRDAVIVQESALQKKRREEVKRQALVQAQRASYRHRSRFQRALGEPGAEASAARMVGEEYDGLPEDSLSPPAHRYCLGLLTVHP